MTNFWVRIDTVPGWILPYICMVIAEGCLYRSEGLLSALLANQKIEHTASTSTALGVKDLVSRLEGRISMAAQDGYSGENQYQIQALDDLIKKA